MNETSGTGFAYAKGLMHINYPKTLRLIALLGLGWLSALVARAEGAAAAPAAPTSEERIAALEAYVNNSDPGKSLTGVAGPGHNAWMMTSSALVLFMTLPGLALFYGGLVRKKNVLSVLAQCLGITGLVTILWWAVGYSLVFGKSYGSPFIGGSEFFFLKGVNSAPNTDYAYWVSQNVFSMYQLMFAIITVALIIGGVAERMKLKAMIIFLGIWTCVVYLPVAHWIWGGGWLAKLGALDFAGGAVVHITAGVSVLAASIILGKRLSVQNGNGDHPHNIPMVVLGGGLVAWLGVGLAGATSERSRHLVWEVQGLGLLALGTGWLSALDSAGFLRP